MDFEFEIINKFGNDYKVDGYEFRYNCPFCLKRRGKEDTDKKMYANKASGLFHCFKCGAKGSLKPKEPISNSSELLKELSSLFGGTKEEEIDDDSDNMFYIPPNKIEVGSTAYDYCISRGISKDDIEYYDIRLGMDDLFGRIVIPNEVYSNRGIWTDMYSSRTYIGQIPKYKNPKGVNKSSVVFNLHRIKERCDDIYGVEGVITSICAGRDAVAFYGCHPSDEQIYAVAMKKPKNFYAVLDNDEAGRKPNFELAKKMSKLIDGNVYLVYMPKGKDASDLGEEKFKEYVMKNRMPFYSDAYKELLEYFGG